jgi:hypothetical protein
VGIDHDQTVMNDCAERHAASIGTFIRA